jgi:hypothetical protein
MNEMAQNIRTLAAEWAAFDGLLAPVALSPALRRLAREAFYAGVGVALTRLFDAMTHQPGGLRLMMDLSAIEAMRAELAEFAGQK